MKVVVVVVVAMFASGCFAASPVIRFGSGKSAKEAQHDRAAELTPNKLEVDRKWTQDIRTAKIRIWADDDYRAQNVHWEATFEEQLDDANQVLGPVLGVRLVAEYKPWDRHAPGNTLSEDLEALARVDPGDGVLTVVGLTSSLGLVSATFDQLGVASLGGNHLVVRGHADVEERKAFEIEFRDLRPAERERLLEMRRHHKTAAVLLHELGHNLGVGHEAEPDTIMNPTYSDHSSSFSDDARGIMLVTLDHRLSPASHRSSVAVVKPVPSASQPRHDLVIRITAAAAMVVDGKTLDDAELDALLAAQDHDTGIMIELDRKAPQGGVVKLLDRAKAAGLTRFALATADGP